MERLLHVATDFDIPRTLRSSLHTLCRQRKTNLLVRRGKRGKTFAIHKEQRWITGGNDGRNRGIVKTDDHANGGNALKITKKRGVSKFN